MLAIHFENLLFLLFIAVAVLFQLLTRAASKASKGRREIGRRSTSPPPSMRPFPAPPRPLTPEERRRKEVLHEETVDQPGGWLRKINYPGQIPRPPEGRVFVPKLGEPTT